ncbi:MAG TPA: anti-sigma factor [Nocardioides sp.]|jgi:anti-sigma-K factor RskA|nr:anti-sigma factor [Nocardioides sp.]
MSDIHALSGAYAVDALDQTERAQFEKHLGVCAACRSEVQSFRETAAIMAVTEAEETPPASLRATVLAGISQVRPFPPETPEITSPEPVSTVVTLRRRMLPTLVAAAAVLILVTAGAFAWHPWKSNQTSVADQVLNAPDAVKIVEKVPGGHGELTLVRSASLKRAVMVGHDVPEPASGKTYQLWLKQPGQGMVSAGLMPDSDQATVLTGDAATATAAAVSVEPDTGSAHPTGPVVAVFPLKSLSGGNDSA